MAARVSGRSLLVTSLAVIGLASLAACAGRDSLTVGGTGGSGAGSGTGGAPYDGVPLSAFAHTFEVLFCQPAVSCGAYPVLEACLDGTTFEESTEMLSAVSAVKKGTASYDPNAAATCIGALPTDCTINQGWSSQGDGIFAAFDVFAAVPACNEVFTGLLSPGAACGSDLECPSSTPTCTPILLDRTQSCLPSQCESGRNPQPHAAGEDCSDNGLCQLPSVCDGTCIVPPGEGQGCDATAAFPCGRMDDYCQQANDGATAGGTCIKRLEAGAPCPAAASSTTNPCLADARCVTDGTTGLSTCVRWLPAGEPCDGPGVCLPSLNCAGDNICSPSPSGADCSE
jgi:hypothetical protein